jgi:hypothetical protein
MRWGGEGGKTAHRDKAVGFVNSRRKIHRTEGAGLCRSRLEGSNGHDEASLRSDMALLHDLGPVYSSGRAANLPVRLNGGMIRVQWPLRFSGAGDCEVGGRLRTSYGGTIFYGSSAQRNLTK